MQTISKKSIWYSITLSKNSELPGAELVDPIVIPNVRALMAKRTEGPYLDEGAKLYLKSRAVPPENRPVP